MFYSLVLIPLTSQLVSMMGPSIENYKNLKPVAVSLLFSLPLSNTQTYKGAIFSVFFQDMDCKITMIIVEN